MSGEGREQGAIRGPDEEVVAGWRAELATTTDRARKAILHYELGHALERLGDRAGAVEHYRAAVHTKAAFRPPLFALIRNLERSGELDSLADLYAMEARGASNAAEEASALVDHAAVLEDGGGRAGQARALLERALDRHPACTAAALALEMHLTRADDPKAITRAVASRAEHVSEPALKRLLALEVALAQEEKGELDEALAFLHTATTVPTERWRILRQLERFARAHGRLQELVDALEQLAALAVARGRGDAVGQGLSASSLPAFADEESARDQATVLLWDACRLRAGSDPQGALATLDRALALRPNESLLRYERMQLLSRVGDLSGLRKEARGLRERLGEGPHTAILQIRIADAARRAGDEHGRLGALEAAAQAAPDSPTVAALLHEALATAGPAERAGWLEAQAEVGSDATRARRAWEAGDLLWQAAAQGVEVDFARIERLYLAAAEWGQDREAVLRELFGATLRLAPSRLGAAAERLLEVATDETEREQLVHERYLDLRRQGGDGLTLLRDLLARGSAPAWAAETARMRAGLEGDAHLLAEAHRALGRSALEQDAPAAHHCAAGRALVRAGDLEGATTELREALAVTPGHPYALALLEEVLRETGDTAAVADLLLETAGHTPSERKAEPLLLRAADAALAAGRHDLAADAYREACRRNAASAAPPWALLRLATTRGDRPLRAEALEALATREVASSHPSIATLFFAEHLEHASGDLDRARRELRSTLPDELAGRTAAATLLLMPDERRSFTEALERLVRDSHGPGGLLLRRALGATLLDVGVTHERLDPLISKITELRSDDRWARIAALRAAGFAPARAEMRAEALEALGLATTDPQMAAELLLSAMWTRSIHGGDAAPEAVRRLLEEIEHAGSDDPIASLAADEVWTGPGDSATRIAGLRARLAHAPESSQSSLEAALGRALVASGQMQEAVEVIGRVVAREPEDLASWECLLTAARASRSWERLVDACDRIAERVQGEARADLLEEAGTCLLSRLDRPEEAAARFRAALAADPDRPDAHARLRTIVDEGSDARGLLEIVTARIPTNDDPDELIALYQEKARLHRTLGEHGEIVEALKNVLVLEPTDAAAQAMLAQALVRLERWQEAVDALRALAALDVPTPERRVARWAAARYLKEKLADPKGAFQELSTIERMGFGDEALLARMAHLAEEAELLEEAVAALSRLAAITEGADRTRYERRVGEILSGPMGDVAGAIDAFGRALDASPGDLDTAEALADLLDQAPRRRMAERFRAAVWAELEADPTDPMGLRKLAHSAAWSGDEDFELLVLSVLDALGMASDDEFQRLTALEETRSAEVTGGGTGQVLESLRPPEASGPMAELARVTAEAVQTARRLDLKGLGVGRRELVKPGAESAERDATQEILALFGLTADRFYVGGAPLDGAAVTAEEEGSWVLGADTPLPLTGRTRFVLGMHAAALHDGTTALVTLSSEEAATWLRAAAAAADAPLSDGSADVSAELTALLRKTTSRSTRKAITPLAARVRGGSELAGFCSAARRTALRAGLLASGDLYEGLCYVLGEDPDPARVRRSEEARVLIRDWLSAEHRDLRRDLGIDAGPTEGGGAADNTLEVAAQRLERASGFFGIVAAPPDWDVGVDDLTGALNPPDAPATPSGLPERVEEAVSSGAVSPGKRAELLLRLAEGARAAAKGRLWLSAAELLAAEGHEQRAEELVGRARKADPQDLLALRRARRMAARRGAFHDVVKLLSVEATLPMSAAERGMLLTLTALIRLSRLGDLQGAERDAAQALSARPHSAAAALLLSQLSLAAGRRNEGYATLERVAREWKDESDAAVLLCEVGRAREREGDITRARFLFKKALDLDSDALAAALGVGRTAKAQRAFDEAAEAVAKVAAIVRDPALGQAFLHAAARILHLCAGRPAHALELLSEVMESPAVEARVEAAEAVGDAAALDAAIVACAAANRRSERALALVHKAEIAHRAGDLQGARSALREATHADQTMALVRVVAERLARESGDVRQLTRVAKAAGLGALVASASTALAAREDGAARSLEERLLAEASEEETSFGACVAALSADTAAASGDRERLGALYRQRVEHLTGETRVGATIALADLEEGRGDAREAARLLRELRRIAPNNVIALRRLAALTSDTPLKSAALWLQEASVTVGKRAAFAATMAGRLMSAADGNPRPGYDQALSAVPAYVPALWALEALARASGDTEALLGTLHEHAAQSNDPIETATRLLSAALASGTPAPSLLERAHELVPEDGALVDLRLRLQDGLGPLRRAELLEDAAAGAVSSWARLLRLRAAGLLEDAGELARAADAAREAEEMEDSDPFVRYLLGRLEPAAGQLDRASERLDRIVRSASDDTTRALALEQVAQLEWRSGHPGLAVAPLEGILERFPGHMGSLRGLERLAMMADDDDRLADVEERLAVAGDPRDATAHARLAARLRIRATGDPASADEVLRTTFDYGQADLWLTRRVEAAARESGDRRALAQTLMELADHFEDEDERVAAELRAAEVVAHVRAPAIAANRLARAAVGAPHYTLALEQLAWLREASGAAPKAAEAYGEAAQSAKAPKRKAALFYRSGEILAEQVMDGDRAAEAFLQAAQADATYRDVLERLYELLPDHGDPQRVSAVLAARIQRGGDREQLVDLHLMQARLRASLGDAAGAKKSLRSVVTLTPERLDVLERLYELCIDDGDLRGAAEALQRTLSTTDDPVIERNVYLKLADIHVQTRDPHRAQAALAKVLELDPTDEDARSRLEAIRRRERR